ncbi:ABC transporter permease [Flexithrix dorotheae]|uniref:ABC transporter permease n=1 Tax=Flexithrix dorotheae TaxID=70993 RepID=UPI0003A357C5|nr:ABC transporter permease [Flexithrix dorotheae]
MSYNFLWSYIIHELDYDQFHENAENVYRIRNDRFQDENLVTKDVKTYPAAGAFLESQFPEVKKSLRLHSFPASVFYNGQELSEKNFYYSDPEFFQFFSFPLLSGKRKTCLEGMNKIVISSAVARKYFKNENPIGKELESIGPFVITGVFEKNSSSHLDIDFLVSFETFLGFQGQEMNEDWYFSDFYTYLLIDEKANKATLEGKISHALLQEISQRIAFERREEFHLQPLTDIHLHSNFSNEIKVNGSFQLLVLLGVIAILVLVITAINYASFLFIKSLDGIKEIGLRKILGANKTQILTALFLEYFFQTLFVFGISLFLLDYVANHYYYLFNLPSDFFLFTLKDNLLLWIGIALLFLVIIGLAYIYPVLHLINYEPAAGLKGQVLGFRKNLLGKALLTIQISILGGFLFFGILVISQVNFLKNKDMGFKLEQTLIIDNTMGDSLHQVFRNKLLQLPEVKSYANGSVIPGNDNWWKINLKNHSKEIKNFRMGRVSPEFSVVFDFEFLAGSGFGAHKETDKEGVVVNEETLKILGIKHPEEAIGEKVKFSRWEKEIIGVIKNYHHASLKEPFQPLGFVLASRNEHFKAINLESQHLPETLDKIQQTYRETFSSGDFNYYFLDDYFQEQYRNEEIFIRNLLFFAVVVLVLVFVGIISFTAHNIKNRRKEIAIRKVAGSSLSGIAHLFLRDFISLVVTAIIISFPATFYFSGFWFDNFAFKIEVNAMHICGAYFVLFSGLLITIVTQVWLSARENPANVLGEG